MTAETILAKLKKLGFETVPASWYARIAVWDSWYRGSVPDFHDYRVYNGLRHVRCRKLTAGMAKNVCESWADLLMNSRVTVTLEGKGEQQFFDAVCAGSNFRRMMNLFEEYTFALGTSAIVLRLSGVPVDGSGNLLQRGAARPGEEPGSPTVSMDFIRADGVFPLSWENGVVRECAFATTRTERGREYLYLQLHLLNPDGTYRIENRLYAAPDAGSGDGDFPAEVSLAELQATGDSAPVFLTGSTEPLFFLNTPNIANNLAPEIPMGVSVFANAIDQLLEGEPLFDANDLVFYILPEDSQNGSTIHEIDTSLRIPAHVSGLQVALDLLGLKCGFGPNHWKFDAGHITTATQILSANSEEYRTQQKHQLVLEALLIRLARTVVRLGRDFLGLELDPGVPVSVDFDNSAVENLAETFDRDIRMLKHGILSREEFREKWMNEDPKTASAALKEHEGAKKEAG